MISTKNSSPKCCIKCTTFLNEENWAFYDKKKSYYICKECRKKQNNYNKDLQYNNKQLARYRFRKSAVIFAYGNKCIFCHEDDYNKLIIDHINNEANELKKPGNIYEWMYNNPIYKDGYQVLCYNCNCSKNVTHKDKYALRDKKKVIEYYGGKCLECLEDRIEKLIIDHKNNNTVKRKILKNYTGARMYRWIIKNDYPSDLKLQVLCFNCKSSKLSKNKKQID